jgi:hypothetical protein
MRLPESVDAHPNEKNDKIALNLRGHTPVDDRSHERSLVATEEIRSLHGISCFPQPPPQAAL